jgi:pimeloyl-ACP methyl ester carboxylesterase
LAAVRTKFWIFLAAATLAVAPVAGDAGPRPRPAALRLTPCSVGSVPARCGTLAVHENRATRDGRVITLRVTVVPARGESTRPDPVFWLAGGPGVAANDDAAGAVRFLEDVNEQRDLVFVDQRGTGPSTNLSCPKGSDPARWADEVRDCLADLPGDPAAYTSAWAVDDVDDVRDALGYRAINLYGGSYGATAVQVYLQRHPERVRTATLLSGSLLDVPLFERFPASSQQALDAVFARCAADPACRAAFPDPASDLRAVAARLDAGPVELVPEPATGSRMVVHREDLGAGLHNLLREVQTAATVPFLLHAISGGDWSPVLAAMRSSGPSTPPSWSMMNLTILCHEPWARMRPDETRTLGSYLNYADVRALTVPEAVCAAVPVPPPEAIYRDPVVVSVPMLLLNGSADPQDPPENVASAGRTYPRSLALTIPGQSHTYSGAGCLGTVIGAFIDSASTEDLPAGCLAGMPIPPFKLS